METSLFYTPAKTVVNRHQTFLKTWLTHHILANVLGMGLLHTAISHTLTGPHGVRLTPPQWVAHTISLLLFSFILNFLQNKALQLQFKRGNFTDLGYFLVCIPSAFWIGYYAFYIPFDILFMYLAIGGINAWRLKKYFTDEKKWAWQIMLALLGGALVGIAAGMAAYFGFVKDIKVLTGDFLLWLCITLPASVTYASISKLFLRQHVTGKVE
ncbi:hypothetical protein [Adhaeribacter pallidiroseus]|uniref:Uncharacterized protein n=1 Tax=Adhaeribacter pallidiroseus TaxID=2072847 RepID=A0A369QG13_9BACT|nr:hypothetical protein [Adhaeribacter pallidiroseus]RDC63644.1 hypothetical protein AHMF7616_02249 [Adhaeribacter pallidiroseus]